MIAILSLLFKLAGVIFLLIAAIGVIKLPDPFQRMHAATKAGTLGAGLVIIGSVIAQGSMGAAVLGIMTVVFLLLTVPVAGHLLGRAAYVSGARLSLAGEDALKGILPRSSHSLDERLDWKSITVDDARGRLDLPENPKPAPYRPQFEAKGKMLVLPAMEAVRFGVIDGQVRSVAERACAIAQRSGASLTAYVLIDTHAVKAAGDQVQMRKLIRERASTAINELQGCTAKAEVTPVLNYDEGDPEQLLRCDLEPGQALLVLPCSGWFHHQVEARQEMTTWEPDGLLRLPEAHGGPVLFAAAKPLPETARTLVVRDCGEDHLVALVEWALLNNLWEIDRLVHVADAKSGEAEFAETAKRFGLAYERVAAAGADCAIPAGIKGVRAVVLGRTPRPLRTSWYGSHWLTRIAPDMTGDVLIMEGQPKSA